MTEHADKTTGASPNTTPLMNPETESTGQRCEVVLFVAADDEIRNFFTGILQEAGYTVLAAACAYDAGLLYGVSQQSVDLFLIERVPPDMKGPDLARALRDRWPGTPVIYFGGPFAVISAADVAEFGLAQEGTYALALPSQIDSFLTTVRRALDEAAARHGLTLPESPATKQP